VDVLSSKQAGEIALLSGIPSQTQRLSQVCNLQKSPRHHHGDDAMSTPAAIPDASADGHSTSGAALQSVPTTKAAASSKKKQDKIRSAWISFVGRITAQLMGAVATVALGVLFVHSYAPATRYPDVAAQEREADVRPAAVRPVRPAGQLTVVVLPMQNLSGDSSREHLADGMTEGLTAELAQVPGIKVISRTSSMHYKNDRRTLTEIAGELGADFVVEGSVVASGGRVRVTAQFIDAASDEHVWAKHYDAATDDVIAWQAQLSGAIAADLAPAFRQLRGRAAAGPPRPRATRHAEAVTAAIPVAVAATGGVAGGAE
jgi:TolB-like protein